MVITSKTDYEALFFGHDTTFLHNFPLNNIQKHTSLHNLTKTHLAKNNLKKHEKKINNLFINTRELYENRKQQSL